MFADPEYANSADYDQFWQILRRGEFQSGVYKRYGKDGREIWIQATYNPIFDPSANDLAQQSVKLYRSLQNTAA